MNCVKSSDIFLQSGSTPLHAAASWWGGKNRVTDRGGSGN